MTIYQSTHTLKKYATAGALALGLTLTANSSAWAGLLEDVKEVPSNSSFNSAWDAAKGVRPNSHIPGCVSEPIDFPAGSAWSLCVKAVQRFGLVISHASFRKNSTSPVITILFDGRLGEIFVPYHVGTPRFHDIGTDRGFDPVVLNAKHCPSPRVLIDDKKVCKEKRDSGIAWMDEFRSHRVRRGQEVVYFAVLQAFNYSYIQEWSFRDDGTIASRIGSTGPQFPGREGVGHMHNYTWRLDIDLNGPGGDSVCVTKHIENLTPTNSTATDSCLPDNAITTEKGLEWLKFQFTTLKITDSTLVNRPGGRPTEYELVPYRTGTARHSPRSEPGPECSPPTTLQCDDFVNNDFWVTRFPGSPTTELFADHLPDYVKTGPHDTVNQDLVIWYTGSAHHENNERDEKGQTTPTIWTGFELLPNNLYDGTPFF